MRQLAAILGLALSALTATPAEARFGDCMASDYLSAFPGLPSGASIICVELFDIEVATPAGRKHIRGIMDVSAGWAVPPGAAGGVERGARAAAAALSSLGNYAIDDVTLLLMDDAFSLAGTGREIQAETDGRRGTGAARRGECLITLYSLNTVSGPDEIAVTTAHEIFHCLQYATLSSAQMSTYGAGGNWWVEGSAEYFAALAVDGSQATTDRGGSFTASVDAGTALNDMQHEAAVFFYWLHGVRGTGALMPLLRGMASGGGAGGQHSAMRSALGDRDWLDFAIAYADQTIQHPRGGTIGVFPSMAETHAISGNGTETITLAPFAIRLGTFDYDCGTWGHDLSPANPNLAVDPGSGAWGDWPEEFDTRDGGPPSLRFAGMHTGASDERVRIEIDRRRSCEPCAGSDAVDACLAGIWQMTGGGPIDWMRSNGIPITRHAEGPRYITFLSDGGYSAAPLGIELEVRQGDSTSTATGFSTGALGRWSAGEGRLNICQDSGQVSGTITVTTPRGSGTGSVGQAGAGTLTMSYTCSEGGTLNTSLAMPGFGPMATDYLRIAEEPSAGSVE